MINFELPKQKASIIKVIGVGGGGSNAVSYMYDQGIKGVDFVICNTDAQALEMSPVPNKMQLGPELTEGRGSGANPKVGRKATEESVDDIKELLSKNTKMVFITAGMGKGTGTGGAPVIAKAAHEMGILTVGIVTVPFSFEGPQRLEQAQNGIKAMRQHVDTMLTIKNDKLREIYGNLSYTNAFAKADDILATAARGIAEIITVPGHVNVDFEDVHTVMKDSGVSIMGSSTAEGENRAMKAVDKALSSPLLSDNNIQGASNILLNISFDEKEVLMDEIDEVSNYIRQEAGLETEIIMGICKNEELKEKISVTVIATGFDKTNKKQQRDDGKVVMPLHGDQQTTSSTQNNDQKSNDPKKTEDDYLKKRQYTIEFDIDEDKIPHKKDSPSSQEQETQQPSDKEVRKEQSSDQTTPPGKPPEKDPLTGSKDKLKNRKNLNVQLRNPNYLNEIEKEPAYKRRNVELDNVPHSSEQHLSRYTLSEQGQQQKENQDQDAPQHSKKKDNPQNKKQDDQRPDISPRNPYLHDNVD